MARPKRTPSQKQSKRRTSPSLVAHLSDGVRSGIRNFPNKFLAQEIPDSRPDPIHLHVVRDVPLSPYVIDLSPVQRVRPLVERPDPAFLRAPIDIQVKGPRLDLIRPVAEQIRDKVAQVANTSDVRIKQGKSYPELHVNVDRTKAAYYGITQDRVIVDVITGISSNIALSPNYWLDPKTANGYFLLAQYPEQSLTKTEDLLNIPVIGARTPLTPPWSLPGAARGGGGMWDFSRGF